MKGFFRQKQKEVILIFLGSMAVLTFFLIVLSLIKPIYIDEGIFLSIGKGIFHGKKMYLDYWDHKTPGIHHLFALCFGFFGTKVILYKLLIWLVNFYTAGLLYLTGEKIKRGSGKFAALFFLSSLVFLEGNYLTAGPFLAFFLTLSVWLLIYKPKNQYLVFGSGVSLALAFIFKQVALLNLPVFIIYFIISKRYKEMLIFLAGVALPVGFMLLYFWRTYLLSEFWNQVFISRGNYLPESWSFRVIKWLETMSRVWWLWLSFIVGLFTFKKADKTRWLILLMCIFPVILFVRHYPHYWLQVAPFMAIIGGYGFTVLIERYFRKFPHLIAVLFLVIVLSLFQNFLWFKWTTDNLNKPKQKEQPEVVKLIDNLPGKYLLTENRYTGFYFLADKEPLTNFLYQTGVNEPQKAQAVTFETLKNVSSVVVLWPEDQTEVYAKEMGFWIEKNTQEIAEFPELDLVIYYKD